MAEVSDVDGIRYGFRLLSYLGTLALVTIAGAFASLFLFQNESYFLVILVAILTLLVDLAGMMGLAYKVIADGVERGATQAYIKIQSE